jgi:hypothetical protein
MVHSRRPLVVALCFASLLVPAASACDSAGGTSRGPKPATSFAFDDDDSPGLTNAGGELVMRTCGFSVHAENQDRYFADGQAESSPTPTTLVVYFTPTTLEPPAAGDHLVPTQATVKIILPSPYGTLEGTGGEVTVSEADGWRTIQVKDVTVTSIRDAGVLNATLACGM